MRDPSPWAVFCKQCGLIYLTRTEYHAQIKDADQVWTCPECLLPAQWDDDIYEASQPDDPEV